MRPQRCVSPPFGSLGFAADPALRETGIFVAAAWTPALLVFGASRQGLAFVVVVASCRVVVAQFPSTPRHPRYFCFESLILDTCDRGCGSRAQGQLERPRRGRGRAQGQGQGPGANERDPVKFNTGYPAIRLSGYPAVRPAIDINIYDSDDSFLLLFLFSPPPVPV